MIKLEQSETLLVKELVKKSIEEERVSFGTIQNISRLTGDASTRRYYRVQNCNNSLVVCFDTPAEHKENCTFTEVHQFLEQNQVRVPKIYDSDYNAGYFLEEDLGNLTLLHKLSSINSSGDEYQLYEKAIDLVIAMHSIPIEKYKNLNFYNLSFNEDKLMSEVDFTNQHFINNYLNYSVTDEESNFIRSSFVEICRLIVGEKMIFTHRDYHSRNLMSVDDELVVIDFQDARMGAPQYDLVSLLEDCYYQLSERNKEKLLLKYIESFPTLDFERFHFIYDLMAIQRIYKAVGSFSYIYFTKSDKRYLKYIGYGMEKIKSILMKYPEYSELRKTIFNIYYGN